MPIAPSGRALVPLAPVHGRTRPDGTGGVRAEWTRRSRFDAGWRDGVDLPLGEGREAWRIELDPPVPGIGPWESTAPKLPIDAVTLAALPPACALSIRQIGDLAVSNALLLALP